MKFSVFNLPFASFYNYLNKGRSEAADNSRYYIGKVKAGYWKAILGTIRNFNEKDKELFAPFLNGETVLVPVPSSSIRLPDSLWTGFEIAKILVDEGYGMDVETYLNRKYTIPKSSFQPNADKRPSVEQHYDSLKVIPSLKTPKSITLIDDVLTLGRTSYACAIRLKEAYPKANISLFVYFKTMGLDPSCKKFIDPTVGHISFSKYSGKTSRHDT